MGLDWGGGSSGASASGGGLDFSAPAQLQTSSGWGWSPSSWMHDATRAIGNIPSAFGDFGKGVKTLAAGAGQLVARPFYDFGNEVTSGLAGAVDQGLGRNAAAAGQYKQAASSFSDLAHFVPDVATQTAMMVNKPLGQLASAVGAGNVYNDTVGRGLRNLGAGDAASGLGGPLGNLHLLSPQVDQQLQGYHTQGFGTDMKQQGFTGAALSDVMGLAIGAGYVDPVTDALSKSSAADAAAAAEKGVAAEGIGAHASGLDTLSTAVHNVAHPIKFVGLDTATLIDAINKRMNPASGIENMTPEQRAALPRTLPRLAWDAFKNRGKGAADVAPVAPTAADAVTASGALTDIAQSAPDAALNPTRDVLGKAAADAAAVAPVEDPAALAQARALLPPEVGAAESMAGNAADAHVATAEPTVKTAADKLNIPERPSNAPSGTADVRKSVQDTVDQAQADAPVTHVEDQLGKIVNTPPPAWAVFAAGLLPESVARVFANLQVPVDVIRMQRLTRSFSRMVEVEQGVQQRLVRVAAEPIVDRISQTTGADGKLFTRPEMSQMVGESILSRHEGAQLLEAMIAKHGTIDPTMAAALIDKARRGYAGIPDSVLNQLTPEVRAEVTKMIDDAAQTMKVNGVERLRTLLSSRYGAQSLEAALLPPDAAMPMSKEVQAIWERVQRDLRAADKAARLVPREEATRLKNMDAATHNATEASAATIELQRQHGVTMATVEDLHNGIPPGVVDSAGTADVAISAAEAEFVNTNGDNYGSTTNVATGRDATSVDLPITVSTAPQFEIPLADFRGPIGRAAVEEAILRPKNSSGGIYDPTGLWSGDARLGIWLDQSSGIVYGDISQNTLNGEALTHDQAYAIGMAYKQLALWDQSALGGAGAEVPLPQHGALQNLYGHYLPELLDPTSGIARYQREVNATINQPAGVTVADAKTNLEFLMAIDHSLSEFSPVSHPQGTLFDKAAVEIGKNTPLKQFLAQTIMNMSADQLYQHGMTVMGADKVSTALQWYYDSHDKIESMWRGKQWPIPSADGTYRDAADVFYDVLAVTSVMASPAQNFGRALMGFANFDDMLKGQGDAYAAAKSIMDRAFRDNPAGTTEVKDLGMPTERIAEGGTHVAYRWLNTPEFRKLTEHTSMTTAPKYNVIDILMGRLNLETATNADIAEQSRAWIGKARGNSSEMNFPRSDVGRMADTLGLSGPGIDAYRAWVDRSQALADLHGRLEQMKADGLNSREANKQVLGESGFKTKVELTAARKATAAEETALHLDPQVKQAFEQAIMEHHGSKALAKLRSFSDNLRNPATSMFVTLDSQMANGFGMMNTAFNSSVEYARRAEEVRAVAEKYNLQPHQVQALIWVAIKDFVGRQDYGRLLAHHDIAQATLKSIEDAVANGGHVDASTFRPFRDYWQQETGFTGKIQADRGEITELKDLVKRGRATVEDKARLLKLETAPRIDTSKVYTTVDRANPGNTWLDANQTIEDRIQIEDNKTRWTETTKQADTYRQLELQWQKDIQNGDFAKVRKEMTAYLTARKNVIMGNAEGGNFATEYARQLKDPASSSSTATARNLTNQYVPQPNADTLHSTTGQLNDEVSGVLRGAMLVDPNPMGRYVMRLFSSADLGTLVHENMHMLRQILTGDQLDTIVAAYPGIEGRFPSGNLPIQRVAAEEKFVSDLGQYLREQSAGGTAPPHLEAAFTRIGSFMEDTMPAAMRTPQGQALPMDIVNFWDRIFNKEIVAPDALHDPLSSSYIEPPKGVDTKQFKWESDAAYAQRTRQYGEARVRSAAEVKAIAQAKIRETIANTAVQKMTDLLSAPTKHALLADRLRETASANIDKMVTKMGDPGRQDLPPIYRNIMQAFNDVADMARADKTGGTAELLAEIPTTFAAVLKYLGEHNFEPTYVPDMTSEMAQKYLFGHLSLVDNTSNLASLRRENTGKLYAQGLAHRSLELLGAANVMAARELYRGKLVDFIEQNYSQPLPGGTALPHGWKFWSPEKSGIITGTIPDKGFVAIGDQAIVPEGVVRALNGMRKDYSNGVFRFLTRKVTQPWKTVMLTYSPSWYVKHFMGSVANATLEGVRPADWMTAWRQWKADQMPDVTRNRTQFLSGDAKSVLKGTEKFATGANNLVQLARRESILASLREFNLKLKGVVAATDSLGRAAVYAKTLREGGSVALAADRAFNALGDFTNLNPFERGMVTPIIPFYAFSKAMFKILLRMPIDHPLAAGIMMGMGRMQQQYMQQQLGAHPDFTIGAGFNAGGLVNYAKTSPLTDSYRLITAEGIGMSLSPWLRPFAESIMGQGGFNGQAEMGSYGQLKQTPNFMSDFLGAFTSAGGISAGAGLVGGSSDSALAQLVKAISPWKNYTDVQLAAIIKRIKRTQADEAKLKTPGAYLTQSVNMPKGAASGGLNFGG